MNVVLHQANQYAIYNEWMTELDGIMACHFYKMHNEEKGRDL